MTSGWCACSLARSSRQSTSSLLSLQKQPVRLSYSSYTHSSQSAPSSVLLCSAAFESDIPHSFARCAQLQCGSGYDLGLASRTLHRDPGTLCMHGTHNDVLRIDLQSVNGKGIYLEAAILIMALCNLLSFFFSTSRNGGMW